jgi:hypothetical protein
MCCITKKTNDRHVLLLVNMYDTVQQSNCLICTQIICIVCIFATAAAAATPAAPTLSATSTLQAAGIDVQPDTAWTILAPTDFAFTDRLNKTFNITPADLLLPQSRATLNAVRKARSYPVCNLCWCILHAATF